MKELVVKQRMYDARGVTYGARVAIETYIFQIPLFI